MSWEMSLEDVQEDEDDDMGEEEVESDDESMEEETVLDAADGQELQEVFNKDYFFIILNKKLLFDIDLNCKMSAVASDENRRAQRQAVQRRV